MNALAFTLEGEIPVRQRAYDLVREWYNNGIVDRNVYRRADDLAVKCAEELGELPDNDMTHGYISAWLRKEIAG